MSTRSEHAELVGRALRNRFDRSSQAPSTAIDKLLTELEQAFAKRRRRRETGQEIANRAGLFAVGETVKRRVGIPGLRFYRVGGTQAVVTPAVKPLLVKAKGTRR